MTYLCNKVMHKYCWILLCANLKNQSKSTELCNWSQICRHLQHHGFESHAWIWISWISFHFEEDFFWCGHWFTSSSAVFRYQNCYVKVSGKLKIWIFSRLWQCPQIAFKLFCSFKKFCCFLLWPRSCLIEENKLFLV